MNEIVVILIIALFIVSLTYFTSVLKSKKNLKDTINTIEGDFILTFKNVSGLIKNPVFDHFVVKVIKELILLVEDKNNVAQKMGNSVLTGMEKKNSVISKLTELISGITGSLETATNYVNSNQERLDTIIDNYVEFSNKMKKPLKTVESKKVD